MMTEHDNNDPWSMFRVLDIPESIHDLKINYAVLSRFTDRSDFSLHTESWRDFVERFSYPEITNKKTEARAIIFGSFNPRALKVVSESLFNIPVLVCDSDDGLPIEELNYRFSQYVRFTYSTHSHLSDGKQRYRIVIPFAVPLSVGEFKDLKNTFRSFLGDRVDCSSLSLTQPFFCHSFPMERAEYALVSYGEGELLDPFALPPETKRKSLTFRKNTPQSAINKDLQYQFITRAINEYKEIHSGGTDKKGRRRHQALHLLACKLHSYSLRESEVEHYLNLADVDNSKSRVIKNSLKTAQDVFPLCPLIYKQKVSTSLRAPRAYHSEPRHVYLDDGQFITDAKEHLGINQNYLTLIDGSTGIGKTTLFKKEIERAVMLMPMTSMVVQETRKSTEEHIQGVWGDGIFRKDKKLFFATYDKISHLMRSDWARELTLYVDEAHNWYTAFEYRSEVLRWIYQAIKSRYFKRVVLLSGTFKASYFPLLEIDNHVIVRRKTDPERICKLVTTNNVMDSIEEHFKKGELQIVLWNNKTSSALWKNHLEVQGFKVQLLNADLKVDDIIVEMLETEFVDDSVDVLIMTSFGVEGISLNNRNITKIHVYGRSYNSTVLHQLASRARSPENPIELIQWRTPSRPEFKTHNLEFDEMYNHSKRTAKSANRFLNDLKLGPFSSEYHEYIKQICSVQIDSSQKSRSLICGYNKQIIPDQLGFAALFYRTDTSRELSNDHFFRKSMNDYGWTVQFRRSQAGRSQHRSNQIIDDQSRRERGIKELEILLVEYGESIDEVINEKLKERSFKYKHIFKEYNRLRYILEDSFQILECIRNNEAKKTIEFDARKVSPQYKLLKDMVKIGEEYNARDRHNMLSKINYYLHQKFGISLGIKWDKKTKEVDGKSSASFFRKYFSCESRVRYVNKDGRSSTESVLSVTRYFPLPYKFKETVIDSVWSITLSDNE